ncbi:MAG: PAS domain-containing protein [Chthoniobacterales bacterium]
MHPFRLSRAELLIFGSAAALLVATLLLSLFWAQRYFLETGRRSDLDRAERYIRLCRDKLEAESRAAPAEESLRQLREIGLFLDVFPPETTIPSPNPRYLPGQQSVEAWDRVRGPDGRTLSVIRIGRYDSTSRLTLRAVRAYTLAGAVGGLLLLGFVWLALRRTYIRGISRLTEEMASGTPGPASGDETADPLHGLRTALRQTFAARDSEAVRRQRLLDGHEEAACTGTTDGTLLEVNAAYCRIFRRSRDELIGTNYLDLIPPSDRSDALGNLRQLSQRHPVNTVEHRVVLPDGCIRWMRWRDQAVFDPADKVSEALSFGTDITAEKEIATRLAGLQRAFDQMQSLARTGSLSWDLSADCMKWTGETFRLLGLNPEDAKPTLARFLGAVLPEDRELLRRLLERARENGDPFEHEFRTLLPDGSTCVLQSRAEVRADPKTKILDQLTCTLRDITALREAEAATKRELRFREAIEQSLTAGIVVSDDQGRNLLVNPAFCAMTGWSEKELLGTPPPYPYWPEEEWPVIRAAFEQALQGKTPRDGFELRFRRKDNSRFDVLVNVAPLLDDDDRHLGWLGAVTGISAIQQTRRELQTANERLRIAQDVAEIGIWDWDPVNDTLHWDRQSFGIFGYPEATDPHEIWEKVHSEGERERLTYELRRLIETGGANGQDMIRANWPDGTVHHVVSTYTILRDGSGRATRVLGINRDITVELEGDRELRDANERLAAALEGGQFGTFEHIIGVGNINWSPANYEINGIDPSVTDPAELFKLWKEAAGDFFPQLMARMDAIPPDTQHMTYEFMARPAGKEPRRIRTSVFIERNQNRHPVRLVGVSRRLD